MSSYEVRAQKFIRQIFDYIYACEELEEYEDAVDAYNYRYHRKVILDHGLTRVALITSDYVVKIDYSYANIQRFGGGMKEYNFYKMAEREGFGYLFAKITPYEYQGITFYIMPRVKGIMRYDEDANEYMTEAENDWCSEHELYDLHCRNYGWSNGHVLIFDYGANGV